MEEVGVEEVGETGGWDRGYRTGLVVEGGDEDDGFQGEVVGFCSGDGRVSVLEIGCESLDGGAGAWGLEVGGCQYHVVEGRSSI